MIKSALYVPSIGYTTKLELELANSWRCRPQLGHNHRQVLRPTPPSGRRIEPMRQWGSVSFGPLIQKMIHTVTSTSAHYFWI